MKDEKSKKITTFKIPLSFGHLPLEKGDLIHALLIHLFQRGFVYSSPFGKGGLRGIFYTASFATAVAVILLRKYV